jgi:hypothetical protein
VRHVDLATGVDLALDAIHADRLALLCGAGLSMASPSNLPGAAQVAAEAKRLYSARYGTTRPPLPAGIEEQAEYFFNRGELATIYLRTLVDQDAFAGQPNAGHLAVADLLLVCGIHTVISTNVDCLIETAGNMLFGQVGVGINRDAVARLPPNRSPLLKIHGCWQYDKDNTIWTTQQLLVEPTAGRIAESAKWLTNRLLDRDLVIVGYWTDWGYLNGVLSEALGDVRPARVVVVDPCDDATLKAKAPGLYALGERATSDFCHVQGSGADYLDRLRLEFSRSFVRRVLHTGADAYEHLTGLAANAGWTEPPPIDVDSLWRMRRDFEGRRPNQPASDRNAPDDPSLGLTLLQLRGRGATPDGAFWLLNGIRIRVLRCSGQFLHTVQAAYARDQAPAVAPDVTIAVGADELMLPSHIVRGEAPATIARGAAGRWLTRPKAVEELGL